MRLNKPEGYYWFPFMYRNWKASSAVKRMDAEQQGWFLNLIIESFDKDDDRGYLDNDDEYLRQIAGVEYVPCGCVSNCLAHDKQVLEKRWTFVKAQFKAKGSLIYNKLVLSIVEEQERVRGERRKAGAKGGLARKPPRGQQDTGEANDKQVLSNSLANDEHLLSNSLTGANQMLSKGEANEKLIKAKDNNEELTLSNVPVKTSKKGRRTTFDEGKFSVMIQAGPIADWLKRRYEDLSTTDIDYLNTKFKNIFHGRVAISWSRTYQVFIDNEIINYGYRPGKADWRTQNGKQSQSDISSIADRIRRQVDDEARSNQPSGEDDVPLLSPEDD